MITTTLKLHTQNLFNFFYKQLKNFLDGLCTLWKVHQLFL